MGISLLPASSDTTLAKKVLTLIDLGLMKISHWGVTPGMNPVFAKRIILTNLLGLTFTVNMTVSLLVFLYLKLWVLSGITVFFVLTEFAWPWLNRLGLHTTSRLGIMTSSNLLGFVVSVLLPGTGYNRGFYVMVALPFLLFSFREKKSLILGCLLPLILYPLSDKVQYLIPIKDLGITFSPDTGNLIYSLIGVVYVFLIILAFYFFARENERALLSLEDQRSRSFSSAKFAALGEMAGGIAHEINNPMMAINMSNENLRYLIQDENINRANALEKVETISKTIKRVASIIHSMRNFSREASQDHFQGESIQRIIDETLVFCNERFRNHGVDLRIKIPSEEVLLSCRPVQVSQVLLNLLNNAFDAVEALEHKWVEVEVLKGRGNRVLLSVTDSGAGVAEENLEKIFEPFFTTKPAGKGTGLGLSLSKQIAMDHRGDLYLDTYFTNTRFCLWFPEEASIDQEG